MVIDAEQFREWLQENTSYSDAVIGDTVSRIKRANGILEWSDEEIYLFHLEHNDRYKGLSVSVRSQIKKAVTLYRAYRATATLNGTQNG